MPINLFSCLNPSAKLPISDNVIEQASQTLNHVNRKLVQICNSADSTYGELCSAQATGLKDSVDKGDGRKVARVLSMMVKSNQRFIEQRARNDNCFPVYQSKPLAEVGDTLKTLQTYLEAQRVPLIECTQRLASAMAVAPCAQWELGGAALELEHAAKRGDMTATLGMAKKLASLFYRLESTDTAFQKVCNGEIRDATNATVLAAAALLSEQSGESPALELRRHAVKCGLHSVRADLWAHYDDLKWSPSDDKSAS